MEVKTPIDKLGDTPKEVETERLVYSLGDVEIEAIIDLIPDALLERNAKTLFQTLSDIGVKKILHTLADTVCKTQTSKLYQTLAKTLGEAQNLNFSRNGGQCVDRRTDVILAQTLGEAKGETLR